MIFSSLVFIWYFLPLVFFLYLCIPNLKIRNAILLISSIFFYGWGEPKYVFLMLASICINYFFGRLVGGQQIKVRQQLLIALCLLINLGILGYYKYFNFFADTCNTLLRREILSLREIALPIGISFYTFQALSYVIDVYRGKIQVQKNLLNLALYISFFPQLIAGPIVKYHEIDAQLTKRTTDSTQIAYGIKRFSFGLAKKVLLANTFASVVDRALNDVHIYHLSTGLAWFTILLYTLQIYYDFSGYSDMAIGLGKMFGFSFMENFNYPYLSRSVREFWQRWHISLSTWFREYLYIPLGGNRKGLWRTCLHLSIVFLATGLWHGAGANFILWGAYYGFFIVMEKLFWGKLLEKNPYKALNHIYTLFIVVIGWLLFRVEYKGQIHLLLETMFGFTDGYYTILMFTNDRVWFWFFAGILFCGPIQALFPKLKSHLYSETDFTWWDIVIMGALTLLCTLLLVNNTYNPFIYFRF